MSAINYTVTELAERFGLGLSGDGARLIDGVGTLAGAGPGQLSFLSNSKYAAQLAATRAGVVVLREENLADCPTTALLARDPYVAYAKIAALFERLPAAPAGIHPSAVVAAGAQVSASASIGPGCVIADGVVIGDGAVLGPHCIVGEDCTVGAQSRLVARVTLVTRVTLGQRVLVHPGAVIGSDGFGLAFDTDHWIKLPQLGGVRIGDDCEIGANTTIDRGALDDTVLEEDVRLDNQIQIAHNVHVGAHTAMAGCAAVAGSAKIGRWCQIGGNAGVLGHLELADRVTITAKSLVTHSIREPGEYSSGVPLQDNRQWRKNAARFKHLDEYARRVSALEKDSNNE
ncbi:UDP-3-O-(3-hydroxymyristoyl)glucosamine N-acyltransferase [Rhodanobacter thiooxydans]|uniref:UDP-3-O-acylglucosamine N-acyltransferase n=1 Tax=Rhodanobacter thiooxydans TaxID=416169 RepID=A0A154QI69_9GAMM|nr:UDP-3-O-(3-hydroxymyristoyl)glucosamine N-acyltransferase [Rhodanobacter thiooxydans]EIL97882.1 UDP-3-O-[3-hydroxymyristoyl] glucosamine N-acyltransferase [Rhodanobacter thiooxydans LCS2]KZC23868.1 UDP-3-O-(3-hydroxymyristoyl)glucosamine N-acyltransferase [Rhodanobacter thiooxydans]MCW0202297.1 UDP-3-O-(3-hydroxymyristoyl)glucosamine N-acyltransferase [Rhodanobacter thiooxydans]